MKNSFIEQWADTAQLAASRAAIGHASLLAHVWGVEKYKN